MFFFGYRCYMKKHDITQDTPSYPSNDEDVEVDGSAQENGDIAKVRLSVGSCDLYSSCIYIYIYIFFLGRWWSDRCNGH